MGTEKRARQKAGTRARREAEREAATRAKRRRRIIRIGAVALAVVGIFLGITLSGREDEPDVALPPPTPVGADVMAELPEEEDAEPADEGSDAATGEPVDSGGEVEAAPDATGGGNTAAEDSSTETTTPADEGAGYSNESATRDEAAVTGGPDYTPYAADDFGTEECAPPEGVPEPVLDFGGAPMLCIDTSVPHTAVFDTSRGVVRVALDVTNTPGTVNSFVNLARSGYYDGTLVHRSAPSIGILQGGSPHTNSASDPGPGYTLWDEGTGFTYRPGQLVMARRNEPNSAGAQYFFTVTADAGLLDGQGTYVVFGEVIEGLDVLSDILDSHVDIPDNPLGGAPDPPVTVNSVTIEEG